MSRRATALKWRERRGFQIVKPAMMRRSLVVTDEQARHPFRASQPPHVCRGGRIVPIRETWPITRDDVYGFAGAYFACLTAVAIFIV